MDNNEFNETPVLVEGHVLGEFNEHYSSWLLDTKNSVDVDWYTTVPLPEYNQGFIQVFSREEQKWSYKEDYRGDIAYDSETGEASTIDYLGKIKVGFTFDTPAEIDINKAIILT